MILQVLEAAFDAILRAVRSEGTEQERVARAKREVLALSLRVSSDAMLKRLLQKAAGK